MICDDWIHQENRYSTLLRLACILTSVFFSYRIHAHPETLFTIKEPAPTRYQRIATAAIDPEFITVQRVGSTTVEIQFGRQLVVHTSSPQTPNHIARLIDDDTVRFLRQIGPRIHVFESLDANRCLELAQHLGTLPDIEACYPNRKLPLQRHRRYAPRPNDPYFPRQWYLENRDPDSALPLGIDLNARAAWPISQGRGVTIAIVDDGIDLDHPDLATAAFGQVHQNFVTQSTNGTPRVSFHAHGTAVAGLALAQRNDNIGITGIAPESSLASWVIFDTDDTIVDSLALSDMFRFQNDLVPIQNHSWGNGLVEQVGPPLVEQIAVSNAVYHARGGKGIIMIRAGGNGREESFGHPGSGDANDDGYASNPGVIAVGAVNDLGRATTYSNPGASLLLAVPGGEDDRSLFTTDRLGRLGFNTNLGQDDLANYGFDRSGFVGTSAAAPLVAGLSALILSLNPNLAVRDVQQILLLSSRHFDLEDPDLKTNGAGIEVSHNVGYGIPNAALATELAREWKPRGPLIRRSYTQSINLPIPDDALFVKVTSSVLDPNLQQYPAAPGQGLVPDTPTRALPVVDVGRALSRIDQDLAGKGALIQRGENLFREKIEFAAEAGAEFAVVYNNVGGDQRVRMGDTYYSRIPAVFISQTAGESLREASAADPDLTVQLGLTPLITVFPVNDSLLSEHVGVRVQSNHRRRGDLRITLRSPSGTLSVMQHANNDDSQGPSDWTYYSTHHFFESTQGEWTVAVSDLAIGNSGEISNIELLLFGTAVNDSDKDGLDDAWERTHFGNLAEAQASDPDQYGQSNLIEFLIGRNPTQSNLDLKLDLSPWSDSLARLSWLSFPGRPYQIEQFSHLHGPTTLLEQITGREDESEYFIPLSNAPQQYYRVLELPQ